MKIDIQVRNVLENATIDGSQGTLKLNGTLDRKLYLQVNKVLEAMGGRWSKKQKSHIFEGDSFAERLADLLAFGECQVPRDYDFFETPPEVVDQMLGLAEMNAGMLVLEPSAGRGAIARSARAHSVQVVCAEIQDEFCRCLSSDGFEVVAGDFLTMTPTPPSIPEFRDYDRVLMNPPFSKGQEAKHVLHALSFLKPGGRLVSVMSNAITFRNTSVYRDLRDQCDNIEPLPPNSFRASGTNVETVLVHLTRSA